MTAPAQAKQRRGGNGPRTYPWPPLPPHELEVLSVTSAIQGGLPKDYLQGWAAKVTAETAVDKYELLGQMLKGDSEQAAIDWLKSARYRDRDKKANRGTIVHAALESYLAGKPIEKETVEAQLREKRVPPELWKSAAAMIAGVMEFLFDEEPDVLWSESTVYSRTHGYAGTADVIGRMRVGGSVVPVVIDVKTSKSIYDETALQLCAYAKADFVGLDDGTEKPLLPEGEGPIDYGIVVRPKTDGKYQKAVFALGDPELFECFLGCLTTARTKDILERVRRPA